MKVMTTAQKRCYFQMAV